MKQIGRRLSAALVAVAMAVALLPAMVQTASAATSGTGTPDTDWYTANTAATSFSIGTDDELAGLASIVNAGTDDFSGHTITLTADIDLSAYGSGNGWVPIGKAGATFNGTFDGGGHVVTGLYIVDDTLDYAGLFGVVDGGTVKNLGVVGGSITAGNAAAVAGGIVGQLGGGAITDCYTSGKVQSGAYAGGIAGNTLNSVSITHCYALGDVMAVEDAGAAGGIVGSLGSGGNVTNCVALNGEVVAGGASSEVGRVVGDNSGTMNNNHGAEDMLLMDDSGLWTPTGAIDNKNGAHVSYGALTEAWWDTTVGFDDANGWVFPDHGPPKFAEPSAVPAGSSAGSHGLIFLADTGEFYVNYDGSCFGAYAYTEQSDKWSWSSSTLTLTGFTWNPIAPVALYIVGNVTIAGSGTFIAEEELGLRSAGIWVYGDLTYAGGAGEILTATGEMNADGESVGLLVEGTLTVNSGEIRATGKDAPGSAGVFAEEFEMNSGTVTATGGTAGGTDGMSVGLATEVLTMSGGTVNVHGGEASGTDGMSAGLMTLVASTLSGGTVTATGGEASGAGGVSAGLYAIGTFTVSDTGTLRVHGGSATSSVGIWTDNADDFEFDGGTVVAEGAKAFEEEPEITADPYAYRLADDDPWTIYPSTPYAYDGTESYVELTAVPFATISGSNITGWVGSSLGSQVVTLHLYLDTAEELDGVDAASWITAPALPAGVSVTANSDGGDYILLYFTGTPATAVHEMLEVTIPASALNGSTDIVAQGNEAVSMVIQARQTSYYTPPPKQVEIQRHEAYTLGCGDGLFLPDNEMTRAEAAVMLWRLLLGKEEVEPVRFDDVPEDAWYARAVGQLAAHGITKGSGDGIFRPLAVISRAEFVVLLTRFALPQPAEVHFPDVDENHWAFDEIGTAAAYRWIQGYPDGSFRPGDPITRAAAIQILNAMLERYPDPEFIDSAEEMTEFTDVPRDHWAFYEIAEAANTHDFEAIDDPLGERWVEIIRTTDEAEE